MKHDRFVLSRQSLREAIGLDRKYFLQNAELMKTTAHLIGDTCFYIV